MSGWSEQRWRGLLDLLDLFADNLQTTALNGGGVSTQVEQMRSRIKAGRSRPAVWGLLLNTILETELPELEQQVLTLMQMKSASISVLRNWRIYIERLRRNLLGMQREAEQLMPWILEWPPPFSNHSNSQVQAACQSLKQLFFSTEAEAALPSLAQLPNICQQAQSQLDSLLALLPDEEHTAVEWCRLLKQRLSNSRLIAQSLQVAYQELAQDAHRFAHDMDFGFLYNRQRQVFHIGYNLESDRLDNNFYDLLASEARIASLFAIAKRDVPVSHWLHLARPVAQSSGGLTLLSWSGTMFEYLMPHLLFRGFHNTLLHQSSLAAVDHQIAYGRQQQVPWGISESGYFAFDNAQNYQYRAFGAPGLGYKRGLADDLVVSPYASLLALSFRPQTVLANLKDLQALNMQGIYGFYEAIDYTPSRLRLGNEHEMVRSYMAHHQGMIMLALVNHMQDEKMVRRFHANPLIQSVEQLLQEQVPAQPTLEKAYVEEMPATVPASQVITADPWPIPAESDVPLVHWLSNGRIQSLITNSGAGQLRSADLAFTRWRPDTTQDDWGTWLYIQEPGNERLWSAGIQPIGRQPEQLDIHYFPHMVRFRRQDHGLGTQTEIVLAPDDDVEIRRLTLTNHTAQTRRLRLTSYAEVALADDAADRRHQAFAKLFVESEFLPELNALIFRQRPRAATQAPKF
jgi:cyclic beta-1,2-glucan synthetase